jgi:hypothetical protein
MQHQVTAEMCCQADFILAITYLAPQAPVYLPGLQAQCW